MSGIGAALTGSVGTSPAVGLPQSASGGSWSRDSLATLAAAKGLLFGSAVNIGSLRQDPGYGAAIGRECALVTCGNEMKMVYALPQRDRPSVDGGDETLRFALANGQRMRGHCLIWHEGLPDWTAVDFANAGSAEALMRRWITHIAGRYRGRIEVWDVVNEITAYDDERQGLHASPWLDALGPRYVDLAFAMLRDVDPGAAAAWNEGDLEMDAGWIKERRLRVLKILEGLLKRSVPITRFGLQAHLISTEPFDAKGLRAFLAELAGMGLGLEITEFDVDDRAFPADLKTRQRGVADLARRFFDVVLDEPALLNVVTWDISNEDTWLNHDPIRHRPDGLKHEALPLDADYRRNALWHAMHQSFAAAPDHTAARHRLRAASHSPRPANP